MVEELEKLVRRLALLPLLVPVLLLGGWGLGKLTARGIALPPGAPVRVGSVAFTPRAQLEALSQFMGTLRHEAHDTEAWLRVYRDHVLPVERSLAAWGVDQGLAEEVAWPIVENAYRRGIDPATVVAIILVESSGQPRATSQVGARGLMQIMPLHRGSWGCGPDLYDIESNLCYGTNILKWNLARFHGDERRALLAYNGCVRGTNTPGCHSYPDRIIRLRDRLRRQWRTAPTYGMAPEDRRAVVGTAGAP
jgi:soluble lytic murein transglycosylase-like protein